MKCEHKLDLFFKIENGCVNLKKTWIYKGSWALEVEAVIVRAFLSQTETFGGGQKIRGSENEFTYNTL